LKKFNPSCYRKRMAVYVLLLTLLALMVVASLSPSAAIVAVVLFGMVYLATVPSPAPVAQPVVMTASTSPPLAPYGECSNVDPDDFVETSPPKAANLASGVVLEDEPFESPGRVDRMCEQQWYPSSMSQTFKEKQRDDVHLHRAMRRGQEWSAVGRWSKEDKAKYENARRRMESEIATALRPDPYMIVEEDPKRDTSITSDQPFPALQSDHQIWHSGRFRNKTSNTGNLASYLKTTI
jgi:hypothetical protein